MKVKGLKITPGWKERAEASREDERWKRGVEKEEAGVKEYWIVMPYEKTMFIYTLINGKYSPSKLLVSGDMVTSAILPGFSLDLTDLFPEYDEE